MGLNINGEKSLFRKTEAEYLGFSVSIQEAIPLSSKVDAIGKIDVPTKVRDLLRFSGLVNYYRDMWRNCEHTLYPLTRLCYTKVDSNGLT